MIFATVVYETVLPSADEIMWRVIMLVAVCTIVQLLHDIYATVKAIEEEVVPPRCPQLAAARQRERWERIRNILNDATIHKQA